MKKWNEDKTFVPVMILATIVIVLEIIVIIFKGLTHTNCH